jgi:hypothetical protein
MLFRGWWGYPPNICALLQFLEVPHKKHWLPAVESTVIVSVKASYFLHRVRFGGRPEAGLLGIGLGHAKLRVNPFDYSDLE